MTKKRIRPQAPKVMLVASELLTQDLSFLKDLVSKVHNQAVEGVRELPYDPIGQFHSVFARFQDMYDKRDQFPSMVKEVIASLGSPIS
jgi:hypothetical protein